MGNPKNVEMPSTATFGAAAKILFGGLTASDEILALLSQFGPSQGRGLGCVLVRQIGMKPNLSGLYHPTAVLHAMTEPAQQALEALPFFAFDFNHEKLTPLSD